jgi:hypothetical protein
LFVNFTTLPYFSENRTDFERAVAIFRKTPKRVSCNLKDAQKDKNTVGMNDRKNTQKSTSRQISKQTGE